MPAIQRLDIHAIDPATYQPMFAMEKYIHAGSLGEELLALVKIRASQLNGCAYCLDMHGREARAAGVQNRRLDVLAGWREAPDPYPAREQAALALTEEVTLIMAICAISIWNRMAVSTRQSLPDLNATAGKA